MAKDRATDKSEHKKSKDKKLSAQDKVKKSSKNKDKKDKKEKKAKKAAKLEQELDSKPKVEEQVYSENGTTNESHLSQEKKGTVDKTVVATGDENQTEGKGSKKKESEKGDSKKSNPENVEEIPTNSTGEEGEGEAAAEKKDKSKKKKKKEKGDPTKPHLSGLNRNARRRLLLIDRQRAKIEKRMGIEPGSGERKEEVDKAVEKWTKTFDELNARSAEKKAQKAKMHTKRRIDKTKKRKEMGLSKKQFDKLKRKEKGGKKGNKKGDSAAPAAPAAVAA